MTNYKNKYLKYKKKYLKIKGGAGFFSRLFDKTDSKKNKTVEHFDDFDDLNEYEFKIPILIDNDKFLTNEPITEPYFIDLGAAVYELDTTLLEERDKKLLPIKIEKEVQLIEERLIIIESGLKNSKFNNILVPLLENIKQSLKKEAYDKLISWSLVPICE